MMRHVALVIGLALLALVPVMAANDRELNRPGFSDGESQVWGMVESSTCSDGTVGLESSDGLVCCTAGCGTCGGLGCSTDYLPDYEASDCCVINIKNSGVMCEDTSTAPCILEAGGPVSPTPEPGATSSPSATVAMSYSDLSTCSNGITGIESSNGEACCVAGCGQCGGVGCSTVGLPNYDADDCCSSEIVDYGMSCSETGSAPCYINGDGTVCSNGVDGVESADGTVCCASECDECSEESCSLSFDFSTESDCCSSDIAAFGELCDVTNASPCLISEVVSMCSNGISGIESSNGQACCVAACGQCGGTGCSTAGLPNYDAFDCCVTEIVDLGMPCSVTYSAPCYIDGYTASIISGEATLFTSTPTAMPISTGSDSSTCSNGITGIESSNGLACCVVGCGQCGGVGCSTVGLPNYDSDDCCSTEIVDYGMSCSETGSAPCAIDDGEEFELCSNGVAGVESADGTVCCASSCNECSEDACSLSFDFGTDSECCSSDIAALGELCDVTYESPCIISEGISSPTDLSVEISSFCSNGIVGIESSNGLACCVAECGQCGGVGCSTVGLPDLGLKDCCSTEIVDFGLSCADTSSAPCYVQAQTTPSDMPTPSPSGVYTSSIVLSPSAVAEMESCAQTFDYDGCYTEGTEYPFSSIHELVNMTPEMCFATCSGENALYMGLIEGSKCGCGEDSRYLLSNKTEGSCTSACDGDAEKTCGGSLAVDLYTISEICV